MSTRRSGTLLAVTIVFGTVGCSATSSRDGAGVEPTTATPAAAPRSCHARGQGLYARPDPACTPGARNPAVTQGDIDHTICVSGWTATVRPPESYTEPLKYEQMAAYGESGPAGAYEEDHLIPLELGGSPTSRQNLWPEPGASPNPKDAVELAANRAVCDGALTLVAAQQAMATDWIGLGRQLGVGPASPPPRGSPPATCTARAAYNPRYNDYDVFVHSNQPDQMVRVTAGGASTAWPTDGSGYADVYLHAAGEPAGTAVTVTVGLAVCSTTLP